MWSSDWFGEVGSLQRPGSRLSAPDEAALWRQASWLESLIQFASITLCEAARQWWAPICSERALNNSISVFGERRGAKLAGAGAADAAAAAVSVQSETNQHPVACLGHRLLTEDIRQQLRASGQRNHTC